MVTVTYPHATESRWRSVASQPSRNGRHPRSSSKALPPPSSSSASLPPVPSIIKWCCSSARKPCLTFAAAFARAHHDDENEPTKPLGQSPESRVHVAHKSRDQSGTMHASPPRKPLRRAGGAWVLGGIARAPGAKPNQPLRAVLCTHANWLRERSAPPLACSSLPFCYLFPLPPCPRVDTRALRGRGRGIRGGGGCEGGGVLGWGCWGAGACLADPLLSRHGRGPRFTFDCRHATSDDGGLRRASVRAF